MKLLKLCLLLLMPVSVLLADINDVLRQAAKEGDLEQVENCLRQGAEVNARNKNGWTALIEAACRNHLSVVQYLVEHGADVNIQNNYGNTVLIAAVLSDNVEMVQILVAHGANVNIHNNWDNTALIWAVSKNNIEIVRYLVEHGANVNASTNMATTALILAAKNNNLEIVRYLVAHGADINIQNNDGNTTLSLSLGKQGDIHNYLKCFEAFRLDPWVLTQQQINLNQHNLLGELPFNECEEREVQSVSLQQLLLWSITVDREDVFEALLEEGVLTADNRMISLKLAAQLGRKEMVRALLDPTNSEDAIQAMKWAADSGKCHVATWLLMKQKGYGDIGI